MLLRRMVPAVTVRASNTDDTAMAKAARGRLWYDHGTAWRAPRARDAI